MLIVFIDKISDISQAVNMNVSDEFEKCWFCLGLDSVSPCLGLVLVSALSGLGLGLGGLDYNTFR